jgi:hypothetical protein
VRPLGVSPRAGGFFLFLDDQRRCCARRQPIVDVTMISFRAKMSSLTTSQRAAIIKQMKAIKARIENPRLTIEEVDLLRKERGLLEKQIMNDRNAK